MDFLNLIYNFQFATICGRRFRSAVNRELQLSKFNAVT